MKNSQRPAREWPSIRDESLIPRSILSRCVWLLVLVRFAQRRGWGVMGLGSCGWLVVFGAPPDAGDDDQHQKSANPPASSFPHRTDAGPEAFAMPERPPAAVDIGPAGASRDTRPFNAGRESHA